MQPDAQPSSRTPRAIAGLVLQIVGWGLTGWSLVAGLGYVAILMVNFVGTHGAESGRDILVIFGLMLAIALPGYGLARLGKRLATPPPATTQ